MGLSIYSRLLEGEASSMIDEQQVDLWVLQNIVRSHFIWIFFFLDLILFYPRFPKLKLLVTQTMSNMGSNLGVDLKLNQLLVGYAQKPYTTIALT